MRIIDWSSDVCSSDLVIELRLERAPGLPTALDDRSGSPSATLALGKVRLGQGHELGEREGPAQRPRRLLEEPGTHFAGRGKDQVGLVGDPAGDLPGDEPLGTAAALLGGADRTRARKDVVGGEWG